MTQPPEEPPREVFAQQRRSGCGTLLVALLVLAVVTAIVIFRRIRRAGLDFKLTMQRGHGGSSCSAMEVDWHDWKHLDRPTEELDTN
jgi:hypothetical protein